MCVLNTYFFTKYNIYTILFLYLYNVCLHITVHIQFIILYNSKLFVRQENVKFVYLNEKEKWPIPRKIHFTSRPKIIIYLQDASFK